MTVTNQDGQGHSTNVDFITESLSTIDAIHSMIHKGRMFQADSVNLALANDAVLEQLLIVPSSEAAFVHVQVSLGGEGLLSMFEDTDVSNAGTLVPSINRNRFSPRSSQAAVFTAPTINDDGDLLSELPVTGGMGGNAIGGAFDTFEEWVFNPGTYLVRLLNLSGISRIAGLAIDWYELDQTSDAARVLL